MKWCILVVMLSATTYHVESGGDSMFTNSWFPWDSSIMTTVFPETTLIQSTTPLRARPTMKLLPSCGTFRENQAIFCPPGWTFGWYKFQETYCCYPQGYVAP
ncbi:unnamed protein product [Diamesa serratosioi]